MRLVAGLLLILLNGCITALPNSGDMASGTYIKRLPIRVMAVRRSYLVHVPPHYQNTGPLPLVLVLHGAFGTAGEMERVSGFSRLADRENFIAVYPNGAFGILGFLQHWNAGHSNRGMMAYRYAAERSETVAASIGGRSPEKGGTREYYSVEQSVDFWVLHNKCVGVPARETLYNGAVTRQVWTDGDNNNCVILFSLERWGHEWPGKYFTGKLDNDNPMKGFDAAEIIWQFLKDHKRE